MRRRYPAFLGLPVIVLVCSLLPNSAQAQFYQQGPKLVGAGAVGSFVEQGVSVSLSADGNTAIVGAPGDGGPDGNLAGAVWVFTRSPRRVWSQQGPKLVGTGAVRSGDFAQGYSVSLSADGNTAIVGDPGDDSGAGEAAGAVWVFTRSRSGVWSQQGPKLVGAGAVPASGFSVTQGYSVSLSADGNTAIVGAPGDDNATGAVWVFTRSPSGVWSQQGPKLVGAGAVSSEGFCVCVGQGNSVSLSADGNTAIVGGPGDDNATGAVWVFTRSPSRVWSQQGPKLVGAGAVGSFVEQGVSVSLSADGNTAIVGAPGDDNATGAVWVFTRSPSGVWSQLGPKLVGTGAVGCCAEQGASVSLSGDGNIAIVGGPGDDSAASGPGAAWVFTRSSTGVWSQQGPKLVGTGTIGPAVQGSVSLSADGKTAIVGGPEDNDFAGAAWVFAPLAGTPGAANCHGQSIQTLVREFGGLNAAAAGLGLSGVPALQNAVLTYCGQ